MNKALSCVVRATLVSLGLLWACKFFGGIWDYTLEAFFAAREWITDHLLLITGLVATAIGIGWRKGWDWITWLRGLLGIPESAFGKIVLAFAIFMIAVGTLSIGAIGSFCCFFMIWIGTLSMFLAPGDEPKIHPDHYHRKHMAERLAELLLNTPENIRRIGILAEWGEGKTQLMKLLEAQLRDNKSKRFRMAWVNPWRASSRNDAWIEIARGVDQALGFPRLLPQSVLSIPGIGGLLELLPKPLSGFTADLKTLLTSEGTASDKIATGLTEFLTRRNQWLLIFVDEMERVGPKELRKVFPIIDRLIDLERCYFIFAIDPKRVAKAFKETSAHEDETKGYLDKILDIQMSLPLATKGEVYEMLRHRLDHEACPRLSTALPKLKDYLPLNPRLADRFLRDADGRERMFLSRFGLGEENYEGFFLLLILEVCYPSAFKRVSENTAFFEELSVAELFGQNAKKTKFDEMVTDLTLGHPPSKQEELKKLLRRLHTLCSMYLKYDMGENALDLHWALEGYRKFIRFTLEERSAFIKLWALNHGKLPLDELLRKVGDFSEPDLVVRQALELELEEIRRLFREAYRAHFEERPLTELETRLIGQLERFTRHAEATEAGRLTEFDRNIFSRELFDAWMKVLESSPLRDLPDEFIERILSARADLTRAWVKLLEPESRFEFAYSGYLDLIRSAPSETSSLIKKELEPVSDVILGEFSRKAVELMRNQLIPDFFPPSWMKGSSIRELRDPVSWLPRQQDQAIQLLDDLATEAETNETLRDNFVWLVRREFLNAYRLGPSEGSHEQSGARKTIQEHPWYFKGCWDAVWRNPPIPGIARDLIRLRDRALMAEEAIFDENSIAGLLRELHVPDLFRLPS